jgi:hypothetical protein
MALEESMTDRRELDRQLERLITGFGGDLALFVRNLHTGEVI